MNLAIQPVRSSGPWFPTARGAFASLGVRPLQLLYGAPWKKINNGRTYYVACLSPAFDRYRTSDGRTFAWCIRRGMLDMGLLCGLRWWLTTNPAAAHFRFGLENSDVMFSKTGHSGYVRAYRGSADIFLGDQLKPQFGRKPPSSINYTRFAMHGFQIASGLATYDSGAGTGGMSDANFSSPIAAPGWGWNANERRQLADFGPPWLRL